MAAIKKSVKFWAQKGQIGKNSEKGIGALTLIVFGSFLIAFVYTFYSVAPFYYYYFEMRNHVKAAGLVAGELRDDQIRKRLLGYMKEFEIPASESDLVINRQDNSIRIVLEYKEEFYIRYKGKDYSIYIFPFLIDETIQY